MFRSLVRLRVLSTPSGQSQTRGLRILSLDVGSRNFAHCVFDTETKCVLSLANMDLLGKRSSRQSALRRSLVMPEGVPGVVKSEIYHILAQVHAFHAHMTQTFGAFDAVVIENQFKGEMRVIQAALAALFTPPGTAPLCPEPDVPKGHPKPLSSSPVVFFLQPAVVRASLGIPKVRSYKKRKEALVQAALSTLQSEYAHDPNVDRWIACLDPTATTASADGDGKAGVDTVVPKADDLADAFLQAHFWATINNTNEGANTEDSSESKPGLS